MSGERLRWRSVGWAGLRIWFLEPKKQKALCGSFLLESQCWGDRDGWIPGACCRSSLLGECQTNERPCLKEQDGECQRERERHLKLTSGIHTHMNPCVQYQHSHMHSYIQPPGYTHTNRKVDCLGTFFQITLHHDHTDGLQVNKPGSSQSQAWKNSWSPRDSSKGLLLTAPLLQPSVNPNELRAARNYKAKQRYWEIVEASTCFNATNLVGSVGELTPVLTDRRLRCS